MNRRRQWQLATLALALAAGTARAQTGSYSSETIWTPRAPQATSAATWEFTTTRADGEARLQMQAGQGATAVCERITLRLAGTSVTLTTDGQKVRVSAGERGGPRIEASADRVRCGGADVLTLEGEVQARFDHKGQCAQIIKGGRVRLNLGTSSIHLEGGASLTSAGPAPVSLDTGFPVAKPEEQPQVFSFWQSFTR